ncbi:MAG TPA: TolC family protein [Candidatus Tripitaka californicus]|uniref:TolC family protein n=1 Tax=Candidatus Tripitaka californicus TaxID=3367616 RepID=UPI004029647A|nr:TolC family protein [Planctomycetota bacterium]
MKKSLMIFFVWMFGYTGLAWAESAPGVPKTLRLQWVIDETLKNNPNIQVFLNRWEASQEAIAGARSLDDPMVNLHTWNMESPVRVTPDWNRAERRGVVSQKVPFPGKLRLRGKIAEGDSNIAKKDWEQQVLEMLARVKGTYYQLRHLYNIIDINEEVKDLLGRFATIAETRYKVGRAPQRDVLAAQVEIARIIREIEVLERDKKALETRINTILNRDPEAPLGRPEDFNIYPLSLDLVELEEVAMKQRPELQKFDFAIKRDKSALDLAKKDLYFPDPEFEVMYMQTDTMADMWSSKIAFNVPWLWSKNRARVREARGTLRAAEAEYQAVKNAVLFEVKDTWTKTINARTTTTIYLDSVIPLAEQSLKAALVEYGTEKIDFLTLLDSERTLLSARIQYHIAAVEFEAGLAELERVVGMSLTPEQK